MDALLTIDEVAARLRTSPETVRYWRAIDYGPRGIKVGRRVLYSDSTVSAWIDHQLAAAGAATGPAA